MGPSRNEIMEAQPSPHKRNRVRYQSAKRVRESGTAGTTFLHLLCYSATTPPSLSPGASTLHSLVAVMAMIRPAIFRSSLRSFATSAKSSHHNNHRENHKYLESNSFLGSWQAPKNPKEAEAKLALLRREYAKQMKEVRKEYIREVELMALEKQRKDETRREALRVANEERRKVKAEAAKVRAQERQIAQQQFRETLLKERAEKLEHWRRQTKKHGEKKTEKKELLHKQSSIWIDEGDLEKKILDAAAAQH